MVWRLAEGFCVINGLNPATQYEMVMSVSGFQSLEARVFTLSPLTTSGQVFSNLVDVIEPQVDSITLDLSVTSMLDMVDSRYEKRGSQGVQTGKEVCEAPSVAKTEITPLKEHCSLRKEALYVELSRIRELKREAQSEFKRLRKMKFKSEQQLRHELDTLRKSLSKSATSDHRAKQRLQSLEEQSRQQEVFIDSLTEQVATACAEHDVVNGRAEEAAEACKELRETVANMEKTLAKNRQAYQKAINDLNARALRMASSISEMKSKMQNLTQTEIPKVKFEIFRIQNAISLEFANISMVKQMPPGFSKAANGEAFLGGMSHDNNIGPFSASSPSPTSTSAHPPGLISFPSSAGTSNVGTTPTISSSMPIRISSQSHPNRQKRSSASSTSSSSPSLASFPVDHTGTVKLGGTLVHTSASPSTPNTPSSSLPSPVIASVFHPSTTEAQWISSDSFAAREGGTSRGSSPGPGMERSVFLQRCQLEEGEYCKTRGQLEREIEVVIERNRLLRETKEEEGRFRERLEEILRPHSIWRLVLFSRNG